MSNASNKYTILESWPMIKEDFEVFTRDPACWFIERFEKAARDRDWETVNSPQEEHSH